MTPTREETRKDEILGLPDDALDFRDWWQELTGRKPGKPLIARLRYAVAAGTLAGITESCETGWKDVANNYGGRREANILECALLCARLAAIDPGDGLAVDALCDRFSFFGPSRQRHGIDRRRWPVMVAEMIHQSPEGSLLRPEDFSFSPAIAWDLVNRFWADRQDRAAWARRPLPGFKTLVALLVDRRLEKMSDGKSAYSERGATAELMLELLPHGRGHIFPDPGKLLFVKQDRGFREAIVAAQESVRELLGGDFQGYDVRWGLQSHGDQQFTELAKDSAGGAFALGLTVLWPQSSDAKLSKRVRRLDVSRVAVTAKLKREEGRWRFAHVDALSAKMWAAVQRPEKITTVYVAPGQPRDDFPNLRVTEASTLFELVDKLRKEPKDKSTPRWSSQAVRRLISVVLLTSIATGVWVYRLGQLRQAQRDVDHWRDKTLVSVLPSRYSPSEITKAYIDDSDPLDLAQVLIHRRDFIKAERALDKAAQQGHTHLPRFNTLKGDIYYFQNQYDKAAPYYEQAAMQSGPDDVETQSDLALTLLQSQGPDATTRIERALRIQRHVIAVLESDTWPWPSTTHRQKWACAHLNLARLLVDRPRYKARSIEGALRSLENALTVFTKETDPRAWAYITSMQGVAWQNRPDGNRTVNVKRSLTYLEDALAVYKHQQMRRKVYFNSYMLGVAWGQLREGDRTASFEKALGFFRDADDALAGDPANQYPADKAKIMRARGLVLIYRRSGDRAANLEQAIDNYSMALDAFEHLGQGIDAAKTRTDLARAILRRNRGNAEDVETAIGYLRQAADFLEKGKFEGEWSQAQDDLGTAYRQRLAGDHFANLEKSKTYYEHALSVRVRLGRAGRLADTLNGLGRTMLAMADRDGSAATEKAISLFKDALSLLPKDVKHPYNGHPRSMLLQELTDSELSPAEAPEYLAETSANLGDALSRLTTGDLKHNRGIAGEYYWIAERYYGGIPYYSPEYSALRRKLGLLSERKSFPRAARVGTD